MTFQRNFDSGEIMAAMDAFSQIVAPSPTGQAWMSGITKADLAGAALVAGAANTVTLAIARGEDPAAIIELQKTRVEIQTGPPPAVVEGHFRTAWLANNRAIRLMLRNWRPASGNPFDDKAKIPPVEGAATFLANPVVVPIAVVVSVIGVAGVLGVTAYNIEAKRAEVKLEETTRALVHQANMYSQQLNTWAAAPAEGRGPVPEPTDVVKSLAAQEEANPWVGYGVAAAAGALVVGALMFAPPEMPRRRNPRKRKATPKRKRTTKRKAAPKRRRKNPAKKRTTKKRTTKRKAAPRRKATKKRTTKRKAAPKRKATKKRTTKRKASRWGK